MTQVNVAEAKARLSELIDRALSGEEVVIARRGEVVVRLVPEAARGASALLGLFRGEIDVAPDFDDPLPEFDEE